VKISSPLLQSAAAAARATSAAHLSAALRNAYRLKAAAIALGAMLSASLRRTAQQRT
tara:strand:+ start:1804 stop:1974 length:171 start_codon:yes stop_codon:yes gene_type:complete